MMEIKLEPSLSHCIETVAKREYERALKLLLSEEQEDMQLEQKLELLRLFLESADFSQLRSRCHKFLVEGKRVTFTLSSTNGAPEYDIEISHA
jgi:hypothetical protein